MLRSVRLSVCFMRYGKNGAFYAYGYYRTLKSNPTVNVADDLKNYVVNISIRRGEIYGYY